MSSYSHPGQAKRLVERLAESPAATNKEVAEEAWAAIQEMSYSQLRRLARSLLFDAVQRERASWEADVPSAT